MIFKFKLFTKLMLAFKEDKLVNILGDIEPPEKLTYKTVDA